MTRPMDEHLAGGNRRTTADLQPQHFGWQVERGVGVITLNRPERKNPLTFDSYAELRDLFRGLAQADDVRAVVVQGAGGNFCSGGDVHEIIGPLTKMDDAGLLDFTTMTGDLVKAMRACPQPVIAAVEGVCAGAGAILAMAGDLRFASPSAKTAFLFTRVGLSGADMGACAILPRIIGHGRAAELLFTGRSMSAEEGAACVAISAKIESEIAVLPREEREMFLQEIGLKEPGLDRLIRVGYGLLHLVTFFTVGPKETRAWTVTAGSRAPQAAGVIHSDFERGFIRAETIAYDDYVKGGGEAGARDAGKLRLEGKEYVVADGDVMHFRFAT